MSLFEVNSYIYLPFYLGTLGLHTYPSHLDYQPQATWDFTNTGGLLKSCPYQVLHYRIKRIKSTQPILKKKKIEKAERGRHQNPNKNTLLACMHDRIELELNLRESLYYIIILRWRLSKQYQCVC